MSTDSLSRAKEKLSQKDPKGAEELLISTLKHDRANAEALYTLGNLYHHQGKFERAIVVYKKALSLKPNYTEAALSLSILYNDLGQYQEGRLVFNRIKKQVPTSEEKVSDTYLDEKLAEKHCELGSLYESYRRYGEAHLEYQKALKLRPEDPTIIVKIAVLQEKEGKSDQTIKMLKNLSHDRPDYIPGLIKLGLAFYAQGKMIDAIRQWEKVLDIEPKHSEALMYLDMAQKAETTSL